MSPTRKDFIDECIVLGASVGLSPTQVYELEYWELLLYTEGYREKLYNEQCNVIKTAYYTGMFSRESKQKPKSLSYYLDQLDKQFHKKEVDKPVDVDLSRSIHDKIQQLKRKGGSA